METASQFITEEHFVSGCVSVVTPTYNRADLLVRAVTSVMQQAYRNWELIVVDDGSTDNTRAVMQPFLRDPRVQYLHQDNAGQSAARNRALAHARGEYVMFLDSDNTWRPTALEALVRTITQQPDYGVILGESYPVDARGESLPRSPKRRYTGWVTGQLLCRNFVAMNSTLVRHSILRQAGRFDEALRSGEDYDLWLRVSLLARFLPVPEHVTDYRVEGERISRNEEANFVTNERILRRFLDTNSEQAREWPVADALAQFYSRRARSRFRAGDRRRAITDSLNAIRANPLLVHGWRTLAAVSLRPVPALHQ